MVFFFSFLNIQYLCEMRQRRVVHPVFRNHRVADAVMFLEDTHTHMHTRPARKRRAVLKHGRFAFTPQFHQERVAGNKKRMSPQHQQQRNPAVVLMLYHKLPAARRRRILLVVRNSRGSNDS